MSLAATPPQLFLTVTGEAIGYFNSRVKSAHLHVAQLFLGKFVPKDLCKSVISAQVVKVDKDKQSFCIIAGFASETAAKRFTESVPAPVESKEQKLVKSLTVQATKPPPISVRIKPIHRSATEDHLIAILNAKGIRHSGLHIDRHPDTEVSRNRFTITLPADQLPLLKSCEFIKNKTPVIERRDFNKKSPICSNCFSNDHTKHSCQQQFRSCARCKGDHKLDQCSLPRDSACILCKQHHLVLACPLFRPQWRVIQKPSSDRNVSTRVAAHGDWHNQQPSTAQQISSSEAKSGQVFSKSADSMISSLTPTSSSVVSNNSSSIANSYAAKVSKVKDTTSTVSEVKSSSSSMEIDSHSTPPNPTASDTKLGNVVAGLLKSVDERLKKLEIRMDMQFSFKPVWEQLSEQLAHIVELIKKHKLVPEQAMKDLPILDPQSEAEEERASEQALAYATKQQAKQSSQQAEPRKSSSAKSKMNQNLTSKSRS